jgi:hypothetical protein
MTRRAAVFSSLNRLFDDTWQQIPDSAHKATTADTAAVIYRPSDFLPINNQDVRNYMLIKSVGAARWRYLQVLQVGQRCQSRRSQVTDIVVTQVPEQNQKKRQEWH